MSEVMEPEKNLHAAIPPALLAEVQKGAQKEHVSLDEYLRDTIERGMNRRELDEVFAFGKCHAQQRGLRPEEVEKAIADVRASEHRRQ